MRDYFFETGQPLTDADSFGRAKNLLVAANLPDAEIDSIRLYHVTEPHEYAWVEITYWRGGGLTIMSRPFEMFDNSSPIYLKAK